MKKADIGLTKLTILAALDQSADLSPIELVKAIRTRKRPVKNRATLYVYLGDLRRKKLVKKGLDGRYVLTRRGEQRLDRAREAIG